jgi:hypothetical protein
MQGSSLRKNDEMLMTWHVVANTSPISVTILARRLRRSTCRCLDQHGRWNVSNKDRQKVWEERVAHWRAGGLSQRAYAIEQGYPIRRVGYWVRRLSKSPGSAHVGRAGSRGDGAGRGAPRGAGAETVRPAWLLRRAAARHVGAIQTLLGTAKLNGLDPLRWLASVVERLPTCPNSQIEGPPRGHRLRQRSFCRA